MNMHTPETPGEQPPGASSGVSHPSSPARKVIVRPITNKPYATYTIMAITVAIYFLQIGTEYLFKIDFPAALGIKINDLIMRGQYWRLITPVFLHGSMLHIAFNMYALYLFGPGLERYYGRFRFLALYFLSGFGGNVFSMMFSPAPSLGSSTAIFGLLGAQGVFIHHNRKMLGNKASRALTSIISVAVINLLIGLSPHIDNWGHIGGLIGGVSFAWLAGPLLGLEGIPPELRLSDQRSREDIRLALIVVPLFFIILAAGTIYIQHH